MERGRRRIETGLMQTLRPSSPLPRIVVLDDDSEFALETVGRLEQAGFQATAAFGPRHAMELAVREQPDVVIAELRLGGTNGSVLLAMLGEAAPHTARVLVSRERDFSVVASLAAPYSADAFVAKADAAETLVPTVRALLENRLSSRKPQVPEELIRGLARSITRALEMRDGQTEQALDRVGLWSRRLAEELALPASQVFDVELGAMLHDVGMIGIREAVLLKPGKLTDAEWAEIRRHPELGATLLNEIPALERALPVVLGHHERFDGKGYPHGAQGEAIPIGARIFALVDAYDVIVSDRPYRQGRTDEEARAELAACVGTQFDPQVHEAFRRVEPWEWVTIGRLVR